jgi:hypothetical protein
VHALWREVSQRHVVETPADHRAIRCGRYFVVGVGHIQVIVLIVWRRTKRGFRDGVSDTQKMIDCVDSDQINRFILIPTSSLCDAKYLIQASSSRYNSQDLSNKTLLLPGG